MPYKTGRFAVATKHFNTLTYKNSIKNHKTSENNPQNATHVTSISRKKYKRYCRENQQSAVGSSSKGYLVKRKLDEEILIAGTKKKSEDSDELKPLNFRTIKNITNTELQVSKSHDTPVTTTTKNTAENTDTSPPFKINNDGMVVLSLGANYKLLKG